MKIPSSSPPAAAKVEELVRHMVPDWDDEVAATARFKAFSGQRSDWELQYLFWRDLILNLSRKLEVVAVRADEVKNKWFSRGGLTPLCLDLVLQEMYISGDIVLKKDLPDPTSGRLYQILRKVALVIGPSGSSSAKLDNCEEWLILKPLLQECASNVIKALSENHWTSTCIITMEQFQSICKGSIEASAILSYLYECGKTQYLSIKKEEIIEDRNQLNETFAYLLKSDTLFQENLLSPFLQGVKVSLVSSSLPKISSVDYDALLLIWTAEKLQRKLDVIDHCWESYRTMALSSYKLKKKEAAYRHIRQCKLLSDSRTKCNSLLERVEEVLGIVSDAETTKKVSDAIQVGSRAIKEHKISIEEVHLHLQELNELFVAQKQVDEALESVPLQSADIDDDDLEEEFKNLEMEVTDQSVQPQTQETAVQRVNEATEQESTESLSETLSRMSLAAV